MAPEDGQLLATTDHSIVRRSTTNGKQVIVKRSLEKTDRSKARWRSEVASLRLVTGHPNIVQLLSDDQEELSLTFAYESGASLDQLIDSDNMSLLDSASSTRLLEQMIGALAFLHQRSIIHDDIKPENILWSSESSKATIIDFGAALTPPWKFSPSGTPAYVAPEFMDRIKDPRGDVWALGVTLAFARRYLPLPNGEWFLPGVFEAGPAQEELKAWFKVLEETRVKLEDDGHLLEASMLTVQWMIRRSSDELALRFSRSEMEGKS